MLSHVLVSQLYLQFLLMVSFGFQGTLFLLLLLFCFLVNLYQQLLLLLNMKMVAS